MIDIRSKLARRTDGLTQSPIRKLVPLMRLPGMISLGGGYPNPETFAFQSIRILFKSGHEIELKDASIDLACQYGPTDANPDLKPQLIAWHKFKDGIDLKPEQIQVLNGSQEGLHIMAYLFLEESDCVVVSEPAYPGATGAFRAFSHHFIPIPVDSEGMQIHVLEMELLNRKNNGSPMPKFIYEVPNGHNPAGVSLSLDRRRRLIELARRYDLLILEDDPYQLVKLESGARQPTLQSMDEDGRVLRLDSFSKIFAPGLRIGYASGHPDIIQRFNLYKQGSNLHTSSMVQTILAGFLTDHGLEGFMNLINENCAIYRRNRDLVVAAAQKRLPDYVRFAIPKEGMFLWFTLPEGFDSNRMVEKDGIEQGILMVPGTAFSVTNGLKNCLRASFSMINPNQVEEAILRFKTIIEKEAARL